MIPIEKFRKHFNLQNGEKCFLFEDKLVVTSSMKINPDDYQHKDGNVLAIRKLRLALNVFFTILIFTLSFYFGIYPLILLMFLVMWDVRQLQRYKHKVSYTNCISFDRIEKVSVRRGRFGFNYIDVIFKSEKGEQVLRPLKLYDSNEEFQVALNSFESLGFLDRSKIKLAQGEKIEGKEFKCNSRTSVVFGEDGLYYHVDGKYDSELKDHYLFYNVTAGFILFVLGMLMGKKFALMMEQGIDAPGIIIILTIAMFSIIPLKLFNISKAHFIAYDDIVGAKIHKKYNIKVFFSKGRLKLKRVFPILKFKELDVFLKELAERTSMKNH